MSEQNPEQIENLTLHYNGDELFEMSPENSSLYTFIGKTVIGDMEIENSAVNHVFVRMSAEDEPAQGMYLFSSYHEVFAKLAHHMVQHSYPMVLNQRTVPECDLRAFFNEEEKLAEKFSAEIPDELPEDFK